MSYEGGPSSASSRGESSSPQKLDYETFAELAEDKDYLDVPALLEKIPQEEFGQTFDTFRESALQDENKERGEQVFVHLADSLLLIKDPDEHQKQFHHLLDKALDMGNTDHPVFLSLIGAAMTLGDEEEEDMILPALERIFEVSQDDSNRLSCMEDHLQEISFQGEENISRCNELLTKIRKKRADQEEAFAVLMERFQSSSSRPP